MTRDKRTLLLTATLLLCGAVLLKWWYRSATLEDLAFVLRPVSGLVSLFTGEAYLYRPQEGYLFPGLRILIDRSCSGINFMVIATATFALLVVRRTDGGCARPLLALLTAFGAYALTIGANAGRILFMVWSQRMGLHLAPTAHEAVGAAFFLIALLLASLLLRHLLARTTPVLPA